MKNKMKKQIEEIGKQIGTRVIGTGKQSFSIKKFENGVIIRRNKEDYKLENWHCGELAHAFRKMAYPECFIAVEVEDEIRQAEKNIIEKIKNLQNPYSEDIFPKITKLQIEQIDVLLKTHLDFPLDRLSASLMRKARENCKEDIIKSIGDSDGIY